jgi:hypothetical protein
MGKKRNFIENIIETSLENGDLIDEITCFGTQFTT